MHKTYTYQLYNNKKYIRKYNEWIDTCRYVYNVAKEAKESALQAGIHLSGFDLAKQLTQCKKEFPWLSNVGCETLREPCHRVDKTFKRFFKKVSKYPKWAKKEKYKTLVFRTTTVRQTEKGFYLPKFYTVKVFNNRKIKGKIQCANLTLKAGKLFLNVVVIEDTVINNTNKNQVGIDLGVKHFITTSNGSLVNNPRFLKNKLDRLKIENQSLSRKQKGSKSFNKQVIKLQKLYASVRNTRKDFLHKLSTEVALKNYTVFVEDLDITRMCSDKIYAKHIYDSGWRKFNMLLSYKTNVVKVPPHFTSQTCSSCGSVDKNSRKTQSKFICTSCNHSENADINAAKNILKLGRQLLEDSSS